MNTCLTLGTMKLSDARATINAVVDSITQTFIKKSNCFKSIPKLNNLLLIASTKSANVTKFVMCIKVLSTFKFYIIFLSKNRIFKPTSRLVIPDCTPKSKLSICKLLQISSSKKASYLRQLCLLRSKNNNRPYKSNLVTLLTFP
jgi:hypothetical protein